jgi:hypothetical protein
MTAATKPRRGILDWLAAIEDGTIIRTAFFAMLAGTATVLYIDYRELDAAAATEIAMPLEPDMPSFDPTAPDAPAGPNVTSDGSRLKQPLAIALGKGGVLSLTGTIDRGAGDRFQAEVDARGEYIKTVAFDSPGGSVDDAIRIGELIHESGFATNVAAGAICASSCPLAFAGGIERHATSHSAIGVHQIYSARQPGIASAAVKPADAMSNAQKTTAEVTKHLTRMGVDAAVWIHALETPPERIYYLSAAELTTYRLATVIDPTGDKASVTVGSP